MRNNADKCSVWIIKWIILNIYLHYFSFTFQTSDFKQSIHCHWKRCRWSSKQQRAIIICFVHCIDTMIRLCCYVYLINLFYFINHFLAHNLYWFHFCHIKEVKLFFSFRSKIVSIIRLIYLCEQHKVIVWVILNIY